ncbi:MAG: hypothetical protein ACOZDY_02795 [Pseudomonadota bacterium]
MFTGKLPTAQAPATGAFADAAACEQWLAQLQLSDIRAAHRALLRAVTQLNHFAIAPIERLKILERLTETVAHVQSEFAKRLVGRPLPLVDAEAAALKGLIGLWAQMVTGYRHVLGQAAGNAELAAQRPLLTQRCLRYTGAQIIDFLRMRYEIPGDQWPQLHAVFAYAEGQRFADAPVAEPGGAASSCRAVYVETLLVCHANPYELTPKQLEITQRWLRSWCGNVAVNMSPKQGDDNVPCLAVYLKGQAGLQSLKQVTISEATRYLDLSDISKIVRVKQVLLQQGQTPEQLGLGRDCEQPGCGQLLAQLHKVWCEGVPVRSFERRQTVSEARVAFGLPATWQFVAGKPFTQPGQKRRPGGAPAWGGAPVAKAAEAPVKDEIWAVKDESVVGMRIEREGGGERLVVNRLTALKLSTATWHLLGVVRWLVVGRTGALQAGLRTLPGVPNPVAVRPTGPGIPLTEPWVEAMFLPEVPSLKLPGSLVLPRGLYQPHRLLELHRDDAARKVKLELLVERGVDYERVSFSAA